jgi:hypothetical protein
MRRMMVLTALIVIVFAACAEDEPTVGATAATGGTGAAGATATGPTNATGPTGSPTASVAPELEDGRHFGFVRSVDPAELEMVFDLAYFLQGGEANEAAAERGDEVPVPNDYYIINDNPRLRSLVLASDVSLDLLDWNRCCDELFEGDLEAFATAFDRGEPFESGGFIYQGPASPYWLTVRDGEVVRV